MVCYSDLYCVAETKVLFHSILMINIAFFQRNKFWALKYKNVEIWSEDIAVSFCIVCKCKSQTENLHSFIDSTLKFKFQAIVAVIFVQ